MCIMGLVGLAGSPCLDLYRFRSAHAALWMLKSHSPGARCCYYYESLIDLVSFNEIVIIIKRYTLG